MRPEDPRDVAARATKIVQHALSAVFSSGQLDFAPNTPNVTEDGTIAWVTVRIRVELQPRIKAGRK